MPQNVSLGNVVNLKSANVFSICQVFSVDLRCVDLITNVVVIGHK